MLRHIPDNLKTKEMCDTAVHMEPGAIMVLDGVLLRFPLVQLILVPDHIKTQKSSCLVEDVPDRLLMQEMCDIALRMEPWSLRIIPDYFKSQEICDEAAARHPYMLENVPDWFVRKQQIKPWDDDYHDELIKWYKGYQKRKAQRSQIKKELMRIAWHPSRWWDWRVPEHEKKKTEKFWVQGTGS